MENAAKPSPTRPRLRISAAIAPITAIGFVPVLASHLPSRHWIVDLPACFPVQGGAALLLGAAALFVARRPWLGLSWLLGSLAAAWAVVPGWLEAGRGNTATGSPVSLLAVNLARGNEHNSAAALAEIRRRSPDILFLNEVTPSWHGRLAPALTDYPHRHVTADPGYFGVALYSRLPLREVATIPLGYDWAPAIRGVVETPAGPLGVLGVHLPRPGRGQRCAERDRGLAAIAPALAALPDRSVVLGDFNATPWNRSFRELLGSTGLHHISGDRFRPTWPAHWPWPLRIPIDHVLVTDAIDVERVVLGASFGSDHLPLFAKLRL